MPRNAAIRTPRVGPRDAREAKNGAWCFSRGKAGAHRLHCTSLTAITSRAGNNGHSARATLAGRHKVLPGASVTSTYAQCVERLQHRRVSGQNALHNAIHRKLQRGVHVANDHTAGSRVYSSAVTVIIGDHRHHIIGKKNAYCKTVYNHVDAYRSLRTVAACVLCTWEL